MVKPRLHWFWRGAIAVIIVCCCYWSFRGHVIDSAEWLQGQLWSPFRHRMAEGITITVCVCLPSALLAMTVYGLLTYLTARGAGLSDGEIHCRKCNYILRGITEPRCPECGERI